jgi:hypothetical protein
MHPIAKGSGSAAFGKHNRVYGTNSAAFNYNNRVSGSHNFVINEGNKVVGDDIKGAFVAGHGNEAKNNYQTVVGSYSVVNQDDVFVVGIG